MIFCKDITFRISFCLLLHHLVRTYTLSPSPDVVEIAVNNDELYNDIPLSELALADLKDAIVVYIESELNQTVEIVSFDVSVCDVQAAMMTYLMFVCSASRALLLHSAVPLLPTFCCRSCCRLDRLSGSS